MIWKKKNQGTDIGIYFEGKIRRNMFVAGMLGKIIIVEVARETVTVVRLSCLADDPGKRTQRCTKPPPLRA
jgi:hypothetical protein